MGRYHFVEGLGFRPQLRLPSQRTQSDAGYIAVRSKDGSILVGVAVFMPARSDIPVVVLDVVTATKMNTAMEHQPLKADELNAGLRERGHVVLQQLHFAFDSAEILPQSAATLTEIAKLLKKDVNLRLLVVGHTDSQGSFDYNLQLSSARAQAVKAYLEKQHAIAPSRLQAAGAGMMAPVAGNKDEAGRQLNRRVELVEL